MPLIMGSIFAYLCDSDGGFTKIDATMAESPQNETLKVDV